MKKHIKMQYPYVTSAIDNPRVRSVIDKYIRWDNLDIGRSKIAFNIDRDKSQIFGCAVEILLDFMVNVKSGNGTKTDRYEKRMDIYLSRVNERLPEEDKEGYKNLYIHSELIFRHNYLHGKRAAKVYTDGKLVKLQDVVNEYAEAISYIKTNFYNLFGNQKTKTFHAILRIAKYYCNLNTPLLNINPAHYFLV